MNLSAEDRRNSLFTDDMYKDVAKEDLIFLQDSLESGNIQMAVGIIQLKTVYLQKIRQNTLK